MRDYLNIIIEGCKITEIQRYRDAGLQKYRDTGMRDYRDTGIHGYGITEIQGYMDAGSQKYQKYRDTVIYRHLHPLPSLYYNKYWLIHNSDSKILALQLCFDANSFSTALISNAKQAKYLNKL